MLGCDSLGNLENENISNNNNEIENIMENTNIEKVYSEQEVKKIVKETSITSILFSLVSVALVVLIILLFLTYKGILGNIYYSMQLLEDDDFLKYVSVLNLYEKHYIDEMDMSEIIDYSIFGVVSATEDKYGMYIPKSERNITSSNLKTGNYFGLGVTLKLNESPDKKVGESSIEIIDIVEDSPAGRSELSIGDKIVKINGEYVTSELYDDLLTQIKEQTINSVTFETESGRIIVIELGSVKSPKVEYKVVDGIGYIHIYTFVMDTVDLFKDAIDNMVEVGVSEIVFDLRNNSGGDADAVVAMLDYILDECLIIDIKKSNGDSEQIYSDKNFALPPDVVIKILVNSGSASASELFIMSLQDNRDAIIIGEKTYGKSTVLTYFTFKDGSVLGMSTGEYYPQSGRYIEGDGIEPDIVLSDGELVLSIEELIDKGLLDKQN